ncbi:MAG: UUP1 family membrane protein [Elusimicrobiota bacterium]
MTTKNNIFSGKGYSITLILLTILPLLLVLYKIIFLGYTFSSIIPQIKYSVDIIMTLQGYGEDVDVKTYLPQNDSRQSISDELNNSAGFTLELLNDTSGRVARWNGNRVSGNRQVGYSFVAQSESVVYKIEDDVTISRVYPSSFNEYLGSTTVIQLDDPVINSIFKDTVPKTENMKQTLKSIFDYVSSLKSVPFKGVTDAVTAAKLGEASCNGKSRLFIALARKAGIPARLVGGIIMENGTKRTSHQWVETYINGYWVPFDALNNHFAELPKNYLVLYRGDEMLFKHDANINFGYSYKIREQLLSRTDFVAGLGEQKLNAYDVWAAFTQVGIPISLLKIIIMLPLGAFIIVVFRNVIGFETFGTFLPALIAAASRETGFFWGISGFILIIFIVSLVHHPLEKLGVLHTPKMGILMVCVVTAMFALTVLGVKLKFFALSYVSLFPIAVLTITAERFAILQIEEGTKKAFKIMGMTVIVVWFCYLAMNSLAMESLFLSFPELLLWMVVLNLWLGRWVGIRLSEVKRFRWLVEK